MDKVDILKTIYKSESFHVVEKVGERERTPQDPIPLFETTYEETVKQLDSLLNTPATQTPQQ